MHRTYYHGTVDTFVPDILRNGLQPQPDKMWQVTIYSIVGRFQPDDTFREPAIYCTPVKAEAKRYATNKAHYYQTEANNRFKWVPPGPDWGPTVAEKGNDSKYLPNCKPVILKITLPTKLASLFEQDEKADDAYLCTCTIPAKYIEVLS